MATGMPLEGKAGVVAQEVSPALLQRHVVPPGEFGNQAILEGKVFAMSLHHDRLATRTSPNERF